LICDPAHHNSGPTLLLEIHDPSDRATPHRHVHAVEMLFVLRGRVWKEKTRPIGLNSAPKLSISNRDVCDAHQCRGCWLLGQPAVSLQRLVQQLPSPQPLQLQNDL